MTTPNLVPASLPRTGIGLDVHAYAPEDSNRVMMLACLEWPDEVGLLGHSDADVVAHAICDALLNAAGLGDLGTNFGSARPEWAGASGETLLRETCRLVAATGWQIGNVGVQVMASRPRIGKRRQEAQDRLSAVIGAPVNLAATTSDGLGFTGREEGALAVATALIFPA